MTANKPEKPQAIYIDTNILFQNGHSLDTTKFSELINYTRFLDIKIYIPKVVFEEWVYIKTQAALKYKQQLHISSNSLGSLLSREPLQYEEVKISYDSVKEISINILSNKNIEIIETPLIDINQIIDRAIKLIPPFVKQDKGFKDTLILFTLLNHIKNNSFKYIIFISNDDIFQQNSIKDEFPDTYKINICKNIDDVIKELTENINVKIKGEIEKEKEEIISYLNNNFEQIKTFIQQNAEFSDDFIKGSNVFSSIYNPKKEEKIDAPIKKVLNINPLEVSLVVITNDDTDNSEKEISFNVDYEFELLIEGFTWLNVLNMMNPPKIPISKPEQFFSKSDYPYLFEDREDRVKKVIRMINVKATINYSDRVYNNLKLIKVESF